MRERMEDRFVIDLGPCPYCGAEVVYEAADGRAIGRKPPDACCVQRATETLRWLQVEAARLRRTMEERAVGPFSSEPELLRQVEEDMEEVAQKLRRLRQGGNV